MLCSRHLHSRGEPRAQPHRRQAGEAQVGEPSRTGAPDRPLPGASPLSSRGGGLTLHPLSSHWHPRPSTAAKSTKRSDWGWWAQDPHGHTGQSACGHRWDPLPALGARRGQKAGGGRLGEWPCYQCSQLWAPLLQGSPRPQSCPALAGKWRQVVLEGRVCRATQLRGVSHTSPRASGCKLLVPTAPVSWGRRRALCCPFPSEVQEPRQ